MRRQTGTLGADRFLDNLNHDFLAFLEQFVDGNFFGRSPLVVVVAVLAAEELVSVHRIVLVQEAGLFKADVDEGGLECGEHLLDNALIYIAQNSVRRNTFNN